jgi:biopolymer transport protein ExbD
MNVTPFVDVMLVLLIVFMVVSPLATTAIKLEIPRAEPHPAARPPTYVSVARDGRIFVSFASGANSTEMRQATLDTMSGLIAASLASADPTREQVFIRADQHARYGVFMSVVNRLQMDGYYKIGLISEEVQS